ncbi:MAG: hypothetical protein PGN13_08875 [Patulibacter minatonensis]
MSASLWRRLLSLLLAALGAGTLAGPAHAGTYVVQQCTSVETGSFGSIDPGFTALFGTGVSGSDRCSSGGSYWMSPPGNELASYSNVSANVMGFQFTVPSSMPNTRIIGIDAVVSAAPKNGDDLSNGDLRIVGDGATWGQPAYFPKQFWPGVSRLRLTRADANGARAVQSWMYCQANCMFPSGGAFALDGASLTLSESTVPSAVTAQAQGALDGSVQPPTKTFVVVSTADADSGVRQVSVTDENGRDLGHSIDRSGCSDARVAACPRDLTDLTISVDLAGLAGGGHTLKATAVDRAGNARTSTLGAVRVQAAATPTPMPTAAPTQGATSTATPTAAATPTPTPGPSTGAPTPDPPSLVPNGSGGDVASGRLVSDRKSAAATVSFGAKLRLTGRLVDAAGTPITGARLQTWSAVPGGAPTQVGELRTDAKGRYEWALAPGANRTLSISYEAYAGRPERRVTQAFAVSVQAAIALQLASARVPARGTATATGTVRFDGIPAGGVVVEIRARSGSRWLSGGAVRTDARGRFRWKHRFGIARGTYALQARMLRDPTLPALPGASRLVTIKVGRG